jgi:hypothetical protein
MRKLLHIILFVFIINIFICGVNPHINNKLYTFDEFDSLCIKDSIPRNLNIWEYKEYYDDKYMIEYYYTNDSIMYKVILKDTLFDVTKYKL